MENILTSVSHKYYSIKILFITKIGIERLFINCGIYYFLFLILTNSLFKF